MGNARGKAREGGAVDSPNWGTRQELADRLGISRRRVGQLIAEGKITEDRVNGIDLDKAVGEYQRKTDHAKSKVARGQPMMRAASPAPTTSSDGASATNLFDFNEAKSKKEHWNAEAARLRFLKESGELIPRDEVERREFEIARVLRDQILGWPSRVANLVPADAIESLEKECKALVRQLEKGVREITKVND